MTETQVAIPLTSDSAEVTIPLRDLDVADAQDRERYQAAYLAQRQQPSSIWMRYNKIVILVVILILAITSSAIPLAGKINLAENLTGAILQQWQNLALGSVSHNSTTILPARARLVE